MRRNKLTVVVLTMAFATLSAPAQAAPDYDTFDAKDGWICGAEEGLVDGHCLNVKSKGKTWNIKVFEEGLGPQESASTDPKADLRPCPHDPSSPDGTWWEFAPGLWVCHH